MASSPPYNLNNDDSGSLVSRHKRRGMALSCAECRRLKLKCSRVFPCSNCVKKGCSAICPDGSLTTGKGNRFVLANTEALHEKINILANRVRHLEDALAQSHSLTSSQRHPLLAEDLLQIKRPLERERNDAGNIKEENPESVDTIDALGSLSISQGGRSTFFGQTANSWYLLQNEEGSDEEDDLPSHEPPMPGDVPWLSYAFPFTPSVGKTAEDVRGSIIGLLPRASVAKNICNIYFRHGAWMYTPISEQEFMETVFLPVYNPDGIYESIGSHGLGVLFMVLALGNLLDLNQRPHSAEAMQYYQLSRVALSLDSILDEHSIPAIQALILMCHFMFLSDMGGPRWVLMGMAVKLAQSVGLHRDSGKWKLAEAETQKRRELFYELLTYDSWQSLTFGRPPSLSMAHIDSQLPHDSTTNANGEVEMSFAAWKHRFSSQCLSIVHDQAFGTRTANYRVIQELDKKVRTWYIPPSLQVPGFGSAKVGAEVEQPSIELTMQRYTAFAIREMCLFYMHRGFFAQALEDNPTDPMGNKYAPSVLAAYTSACSFVGLIESLFKQHPALTERMWFLFTHVFSCAIVLGSIAVKSRMALAPSALSHLESAYNLFASVSDNSRTGKILPILQKLKERAHAALSNKHQATSESATRLSFFGPSVKNEVDDLVALGGMTRLISRRSPSSPSYTPSSPASNISSPQPPPVEATPYTLTADSSAAWQNYTHIQNFNVNINVDPYTQYHQSNPSTSPSHPEMAYAYQGNQVSQGLPIEPLPEYYSYPSGYAPMQMTGPLEHMTTPPPDVNDSWQNFVAQFKH